MAIRHRWRIVTGCFLGWSIPLCYLIYSLVILWWIDSHSYAHLIQWYAARWPEAFDAEDVARKCFTPEWMDRVRDYRVLGAVILTAASGVYLYYTRVVWRFWERFFAGVGKLLSFMGATFRECSRSEKIALLLLFGAILAYRLYFFIAFPAQTDETFSYLFFVRQGLMLTAASYPSTNNHIFYLLVCALLDKAHLLSPMAVMRLPNMLGDLILFYGIFCIGRYWGGFRRALTVVAGVAFCHMLSYYAVIGRGYEWQEICAVVSALACWACFFGGGRAGGPGGTPGSGGLSGRAADPGLAYPLFIVSSIAGAYINPLFIYHLLALALLCLCLLVRRKDRGAMLVFVRSQAIIGVMEAVLYLPLILGSSWKALTNNEFVEGWSSWGALWGHFDMFTYALKFVSGYGTVGMYGMLAVMALSLYFYFHRRMKRQAKGDPGPGNAFYDYAAGYFIASVAAMVILILYKRVYPQERSLCTWQLAINIFFVNSCYDALNCFFGRRAMAGLVLFLLLKVGGSVRGLYWERFSVAEDRQVKFYREVEKDWGALAALHPTSWQVTDCDDFYSLFGRLLLVKAGEGGKMVFNRREALGDVLFLPDSYARKIPLKGYRLWGDRRETAVGHSLTIWVADRLFERP